MRNEFAERVHTTLVKEFAEGGIRLSDDGRRHWCMDCEMNGKGAGPMHWYDDGCVWACVECGHTMDG